MEYNGEVKKMKNMKTRNILIFIFIIAMLLVSVRSLSFEPGVVKFKLIDYDPTNRMFILKPSKHMLVGAVYHPYENHDKEFPILLGRMGKKVECKSSSVEIGYWVDKQEVSRPLYAHALNCNGTVIYLTSMIDMTATEWKMMMRDKLLQERERRRAGR